MNFNNFINSINEKKKISGAIKYSKNTAWLILDKIIAMILGLFVGVLVARYLGPENFGILNYAFALIALATPLCKLGLRGIITRDLVKNKEETEITLSTIFVFRIIVSFVISTIIILYVYYQKEDLTYLFIAIIASISLVLLSFEVLEYFYIAQVKAKYIFLSKFIGKIFSSLLKIIFILLNAGVVYFAIANSSLFFITFFLLYFYFLKEKLSLSFNFFIFKRGINYLKESWPLIFSGIFAVIYLNIDKIMIEEMLNSTELGIYSVAVKLSTIWYFFPNLIRQGFLPAFVNSKIKNEEIYKKRLYLFFSITVTIAYLIIIPVSLLSDGIINLLFGIEYLGAGRILAVHIFASLFVFIGIGRGIWMINESQFKFVMVANIIAGAINILLNYLWLPKFGIMGAAYATLISYSFTYFLSNIFYKPAHEVFVMQLKSLFLLGIFQNLKEKII